MLPARGLGLSLGEQRIEVLRCLPGANILVRHTRGQRDQAQQAAVHLQTSNGRVSDTCTLHGRIRPLGVCVFASREGKCW